MKQEDLDKLVDKFNEMDTDPDVVDQFISNLEEFQPTEEESQIPEGELTSADLKDLMEAERLRRAGKKISTDKAKAAKLKKFMESGKVLTTSKNLPKPLKKRKPKVNIMEIIDEVTPKTVTHLKSGNKFEKKEDETPSIKKLTAIPNKQTDFLVSSNGAFNKEVLVDLLKSSWDTFLKKSPNFFHTDKILDDKSKKDDDSGMSILTMLGLAKIFSKLKTSMIKSISSGLKGLKNIFVKAFKKIFSSVYKTIRHPIDFIKKVFSFAGKSYNKIKSLVLNINRFVLAAVRFMRSPLRNTFNLVRQLPDAAKSAGSKVLSLFSKIRYAKNAASTAKNVASKATSVGKKIPIAAIAFTAADAALTLKDASDQGKSMLEADDILLAENIRSWKEHTNDIFGKDKKWWQRGLGVLGYSTDLFNGAFAAGAKVAGEYVDIAGDAYDKYNAYKWPEKKREIENKTKQDLFKRGLLVIKDGKLVPNDEALNRAILRTTKSNNTSDIESNSNIAIRREKIFTKDDVVNFK